MNERTLENIFRWVLFDQPVSWRTYGMNGELRRPMRHRFPCKAPSNAAVLIAENVARHNAMYALLAKRFVGPPSPWAEKEVLTRI